MPSPSKPALVEEKFGTELEPKGFERSQADLCTFRWIVYGEVFVAIMAYVDDVLYSCFPIKDLGGPSYYLGLSITCERWQNAS